MVTNKAGLDDPSDYAQNDIISHDYTKYAFLVNGAVHYLTHCSSLPQHSLCSSSS
jgi:hypothetical protein